MEVTSLMSGAKGEEAHQEYKEGGGSHIENLEYCLCLGIL